MIGLAIALALATSGVPQSKQCAVAAEPDALARSGAHDFDFEFGQWRVHHRVKRAGPAGEWSEFEGTSETRPLMDGGGNVEDNVFLKAGGTTRGVAIRAYDAATASWAIWWIDGRAPHGVLDPPVKGRFEGETGIFYSEGLVANVLTCTRFTWTRISPDAARWEQAYSSDGGASWDTNWVMNFARN